jgi:glutathione S-transferase
MELYDLAKVTDLKRMTLGVALVGNDITYADLSLFQLVEGLRYAFPKAAARCSIASCRLRAAAHKSLSRKRPSASFQRNRCLSALSRS